MQELNLKKSRAIRLAGMQLGGGAPIRVQSMTNTDTRDIASTVKQINELASLGCEIIRVAILDSTSAEAIREIKKEISIPLIADIHFDYKLAINCIENGADGVRINPGNIGTSYELGIENLLKVAAVAKDYGACIRVGINSGSLEKELLRKYGGVTAEAIVESALRYLHKLYEFDFYNFKVSLKSSSVPMSVEAYRLFASKDDSPLHVGITEAGTAFMGTIKSAAGLGAILSLGIGDTLRVSLTAEPWQEVKVGYAILSALELRKRGVNIISCPTCGRTQIDLISLAGKVEQMLADSHSNITVAVMGCAVNGPGEAREADYGIAGGISEGLIFRKGEILKKVPEASLLSEFEAILKLDKII